MKLTSKDCQRFHTEKSEEARDASRFFLSPRRGRRQKDQQNCFRIENTENNACTSKKVIKCSFNVYRFHSDDCLFICSFRPFTLSRARFFTHLHVIPSCVCASVCIYVTRFTVYFLSKWYAHSIACVLFFSRSHSPTKKIIHLFSYI